MGPRGTAACTAAAFKARIRSGRQRRWRSADQASEVGDDQNDSGDYDNQSGLTPFFRLLIRHDLSAFLVVGPALTRLYGSTVKGPDLGFAIRPPRQNPAAASIGTAESESKPRLARA